MSVPWVVCPGLRQPHNCLTQVDSENHRPEKNLWAFLGPWRAMSTAEQERDREKVEAYIPVSLEKGLREPGTFPSQGTKIWCSLGVLRATKCKGTGQESTSKELNHSSLLSVPFVSLNSLWHFFRMVDYWILIMDGLLWFIRWLIKSVMVPWAFTSITSFTNHHLGKNLPGLTLFLNFYKFSWSSSM